MEKYYVSFSDDDAITIVLRYIWERDLRSNTDPEEMRKILCM